MLGAKYWYAAWDSAVLDWFEKEVGIGFLANGLTLESDLDMGSGFLAGPLLGYQSDDGIWSVSLAPMVFSSFSQDWEGKLAGRCAVQWPYSYPCTLLAVRWVTTI